MKRNRETKHEQNYSVARSDYTTSSSPSLPEKELERQRLRVRIPVLPTHPLGAVDLSRLDLERDGLIWLRCNLRGITALAVFPFELPRSSLRIPFQRGNE